jgi:hypothetical protein
MNIGAALRLIKVEPIVIPVPREPQVPVSPPAAAERTEQSITTRR